MLAADNCLPKGVAPEAAGRDLADMPTAAGLQADIVERGHVEVALIVEGKWHQRVGDPWVRQRNSRRQAHHAVVQANITLPGNKKPRQWTGHSLRVGAAVDLVESGYTIEQVMRRGDWRSAQAGLRYLVAE